MHERVISSVLVVDDEPEYRQMIQSYLEAKGYRCAAATGADEAFKWLDAQHFDLVISDIHMEGTDGLQLMKGVREVRPDLLFLIITGHFQDYSYSDIIAWGASDFVAKPFDMDALNARLQRIERERSTLRQVERANIALTQKAKINAKFASLTRALTSPLSFETISELVLECAKELMESPVGFVGFIDPQTGFLVSPTLSRDVWEQCRVADKDFVFREFGGLWGWVLKNQQSVLANDVSADPRSTGVPEGHIPIHRFLSSPALLNGGLIGQIAVANARRPYTEKDLAIMELLANIYAVTVQRKRGDDEMRRTRDLLESVLECSAEAIGVFGPGGKLIEWNRAATELFGYTRSDLETMSIYDAYADQEALKEMLERLRTNGSLRRQEMRMRKKDGSELFCELSINVLKDKAGEPVGSVTVALDLSDLKQSLSEQRVANRMLEEEVAERKRVEEALREVHAKLESLVEERTSRLSRAGELIRKSMERMQEISDE
ncbi:MAG: response regulator [Syntrophobacteraceae bacterium]